MTETAPIRFNKYTLPNGKRTTDYIERPKEIALLASDLEDAGAWFDVEILRTGHVSFTAEIRDEDSETQVLAHEVCDNGPSVPTVVDRLIETAHNAIKEIES